MAHIVPFFRSPFTDLTGGLINHQLSKKCDEFELRLMNCLEAYGADRGVRKCADLMSDFQECQHRTKQILRIEAMQKERQRQCKSGELTECYAKPPTIDSY